MVLAVVTAVVDASGGARLVSPAATLAAYRPALILITAVAAVGALIALSGLRRQRDLSAEPGGEPAVRAGHLAASDLELAASDVELAGCAAAPVAVTVRETARDSTVG
jgi:hypothetical protein